MSHFVYILYCSGKRKYYIGETIDIKLRLERHNSGQVRSTKTGIPWKLIWSIKLETRSEALMLEKRIKKRGAKRYLEDNQFGV
jgi:putative endonuclease